MEPIVLVVDDEDDIRMLARMVLESGGFEVREASGGAEAIAALDDDDASDIDAVLLDLRMSPVDDWVVLDHLNAVHRLPGLHVVMLSAHADPAMAARAIELGWASYLRKPFTPQSLVAAVRNESSSTTAVVPRS